MNDDPENRKNWSGYAPTGISLSLQNTQMCALLPNCGADYRPVQKAKFASVLWWIQNYVVPYQPFTIEIFIDL